MLCAEAARLGIGRAARHSARGCTFPAVLDAEPTCVHQRGAGTARAQSSFYNSLFFLFPSFFFISKIVATNTVSKKYSTCRQAHAGTVAHEGGCAKARVRQKQGDVCAFLVVRMIRILQKKY